MNLSFMLLGLDERPVGYQGLKRMNGKEEKRGKEKCNVMRMYLRRLEKGIVGMCYGREGMSEGL